VVHVRVSTNGAGSVTACVTGAWFFAPAGSLAAGTGAGQWAGRPFDPLAHATPGAVSALPGLVAALEPGLGEGLGLGEAAAGVGLKDAAAPRTAAATSPTNARWDENGDR
jgi:hypothetical protein